MEREDDARRQRRWFWWKSQWFYSWPIKFMRGCDEYGWHTAGIVTWAGSIFIRTSLCTPACKDYSAEEVEDGYRQWVDARQA